MTTAPQPLTRHRVYAVLVASFLPGVLAGALMLMFPSGCESLGNPNAYRWTCLLPKLLLLLPAVIAAFLPLAGWLNRRLPRPLPDGWLASALYTGAATQLAFIALYGMVLDPALFSRFLSEAIFIAQPFVTGAITALCYIRSLDWFARRRVRPT